MLTHAPYRSETETVEIIEYVDLYEVSHGVFPRHYARDLLHTHSVELAGIPRDRLELRTVCYPCIVSGCTYGPAKVPEGNPLLCPDHFAMLVASSKEDARGLATRLRFSTYSPQRSAKDIAALCKRIVEAIAAEEAVT